MSLYNAKKYLLLLIVLVLCSAVSAQPQMPEDRNLYPLELGRNIPYEYLEDRQASLSVADVANRPASDFHQGERHLSKSYTRSVYWLRLHLPYELLKDDLLWLQIYPAFLDSLTVYQRSSVDQPWQVSLLGDRLPASQRPVDHRFFIIPLIASDAGLDLIIRVQTSSILMMIGQIWSPDELIGHSARTEFYWGIFFGVATLTTVLAIALGWFTRERRVIAVALYGISYLFIAGIQGYIGWLVLYDWPLIAHHLVSVTYFLTIILVLWLGRELFQLQLYAPVLAKAILVCMCVVGLLSLSIPLGFYGIGISIAVVLAEPFKWAIALTGFVQMRRSGKFNCAMAAIGYGGYILMGFPSVLIGANVLPLIPIIYQLWQYSMVALMLVVLVLTIAGLWNDQQKERVLYEQQQVIKRDRKEFFMQRQFVGMVAHEFRTPLALITTVANNLIVDPPFSQKELDKESSKILSATRRLSQLTDNCLVDARLSQPFSITDLQQVNILQIFKDAAEIVDFSDNHQLSLTVIDDTSERSPDNGCVVESDPAMLRIAFSNVIDNAVKYSPPGTIYVRLTCGAREIKVEVENHGSTIPPEYAQQIFDRYVKGPNKDGQKSSSGVGMGLFAARMIMRKLGGDLTLVDRSNSCLFVFILPHNPVIVDQKIRPSGDDIDAAAACPH